MSNKWYLKILSESIQSSFNEFFFKIRLMLNQERERERCKCLLKIVCFSLFLLLFTQNLAEICKNEVDQP